MHVSHMCSSDKTLNPDACMAAACNRLFKEPITFILRMKRSAILIPMLWTLVIGLLGLSSCKKEGVNQGLDSNNQKKYDFMSTKGGSYWHYGSREGVRYKRFAREKDTVKNGLTYSYYERQEDTGSGHLTPEYFGKNGQYYITLLDLDGNETNYLEYVFWKEGAKKGDSWQNTGSVNHPSVGSVNLYTTSSEIEDNTSLLLGAQTYTGVVHVHSDIRTVTLNTKIGTMDMWFVKDIGVLREEAHINILGAYKYDHIDSLIGYHIEK